MKKKLIGLALVAGAVAAAAKFITIQKAEWQDLSEADVRAKVDQRLPSRVPEEKRAEVADKVVTKMRERGALSEEPADPPVDASDSGVEEAGPAEDGEPEATDEEDEKD